MKEEDQEQGKDQDPPATASISAWPRRSVPSRLGDYEILGEIGHGGMGTVFRARQVHLGRDVAIKIILPWSGTPENLRERFRREARAAARLHHPGIVSIHEFGSHEDLEYFTMDLVEGRTLEQAMLDEGFEVLQGLSWIEEAADAVHYAHLNGVLHRDLKPSNIIIRSLDQRPLIADFGLARDFSEKEITRSGDLLGTPAYMAPEQLGAFGGLMDARTDVHALGVILYEMVSGKLPYEGETPYQILTMISTREPASLAGHSPWVDRDLTAIVGKAMARNLYDRYPTARLLAEDLDRYLAGKPVEARPPGWSRRLRNLYRANRSVAHLVLLTIGLLAALLVQAEVSRRDLAVSGAQLQRRSLELEEERDLARRRLLAYLETRRRADARTRELARERLHRGARERVERAVEMHRNKVVTVKIVAELNEAEKTIPGYWLAHRLRGQIALEAGNWKGARLHLQKALEKRPRDLVSHVLMHQWYASQGAGGNQMASFHARQVGEYGADRPEGWWGRAVGLYRESREQPGEPRRAALLRALDWVQKSLNRQPDFGSALILKGILQTELGALRAALQTFDHAIRVTRWFTGHYNRAFVLVLLGRHDEALTEYARVLRLKPDNIDTLNNRGNLLARLGRHGEAIADYTRAVRLGPDAVSHLNRGILLARLGRPEEAIADLTLAVRHQPDHARAYFDRGNLLTRHGRHGEAVADYSQAIRLRPHDADAYYNRANLLARPGPHGEALADYDRALWLRPDFTEALNNRGTLLMQLGRHVEALASHARAIRLRPTYFVAWATRGGLYWKAGRLALAVKNLEKALELDPHDPLAPRVRKALEMLRVGMQQK